MPVSAFHRRLLLSSSMLFGALTGYAGRAYGQCAPTGGATYQCSGAQTTTQTITTDDAEVSTAPGFSVDTTGSGGNAIIITGDGALSYTDANASPLTSAGNGLVVGATGDNGAIPGSITIVTEGAISAGGLGIRARNTGTGAISITANGNVSSTGGYDYPLSPYSNIVYYGTGIRATNYGDGLSITTGANAAITGSQDGIAAGNSGAGALSITVNGTATGTAGHGIHATGGNSNTDLTITTGAGSSVSGGIRGILGGNYGSGALTITAGGDVTGGSYEGIRAINQGANLSITTDGAVSGRTGISANGEAGALTINVNGSVSGVGAGGDGIYARNGYNGYTPYATDLAITIGAGATVTGASDGVVANNDGTGSLTITANGNVTGVNERGITARSGNSSTGDLTVTTAAGTTVDGAEGGIFAENNGTGTLSITADGAVTSSGEEGILARNYGFDLTVTTNAMVTGTTGISAGNHGGGSLTVTANGDVSGASGTGIRAFNSSYSLDLTVATGAGTTVSGAYEGIEATNEGSGSLTVTAMGDVTGSDGDGIDAENSAYGVNLTVTTGPGAVTGAKGIDARNEGTGALTVSVGGNVTGTYDYNGNGYGNAYGYGVGIDASNSGNGTDLVVTTDVGTTVSAVEFGIQAENLGSGVTTITVSGAVTATGSSGVGIHAVNYENSGYPYYTPYPSNGSGMTITTGAGAVSGGRTGIMARNNGPGALTVAINGDVTGGAGGYGLAAENLSTGTELTVTTAAGTTVSGQFSGLRARNQGNGGTTVTTNGVVMGRYAGITARDEGSGSLTVTVNGEVSSVYGSGVRAEDTAGGNLTVSTYANVSVTAGTGITATNRNGADLDLFTAAGTTVLGSTAIDARNQQASGVLTITTDGDLVGSTYGITTRNYGTDHIVTTNGSVTGGFIAGILAENFGSGVLNITVNGDVSSAAGDGIRASRPYGSGDITITVGAGSTVTSAGVDANDFGIELIDGAGDVTIAGVVNGGAGGAIVFEQTDPFANQLTLESTAVINGNVIGGSGVDTLALIGTGAGTFDVSQLINFDSGQKSDSGAWTLTGVNTEIDDFTVSAGLLTVNGSLANTAFTITGGALGGSGTVGTTIIADGGVLAPGNSPGTLNIAGDLTLSGGSILNFELGDPTGTAGVDSDLVNVSGNLTLDGTLNVFDAGGFGLGVYRLINYGGLLTDGGLVIGLAPGGFVPGDLEVQTSVLGEVNLIVTGGLALAFWDGSQMAANGAIDGGAGTWSAANTNWTRIDGAANGAYDPSAFLVFQAAPGVVTIDNGAGAVSTVGMQFAVDGYAIEGDALILDGAAVIRVGDGSAAGADYTATIASNLIGAGSLEKVDLGTLVLTGTNSYTGGTTITDGVLQLGDGGTSGSILGDVLNNGALAFNRSDSTTFAGVISGSGQVQQIGPGTTTLTGVNTFTGGTAINGGVLQVSADANLGDASGGLSFDGGVLQTTANMNSARDVTLTGSGGFMTGAGTTLTLDGLISGSGALSTNGAGTVILTGANTYAGGTTIAAGTLLINGDQSGATGLASVQSGAVLGGTGALGGDVTVASGGALAPGSGGPGTLTINGNLTLSSGSNLNFELGQANVPGGLLNDLLEVDGDLVLDGTLNVSVSPGGSFGAGVYRLINYGGALTNNGLGLGSMPVGSNSLIQTSIDHQINLVDTTGLTLNFWDGAPGPKNDGVIQGGDGTWRTGADDSWTDASGDVNAPYTDASVAIFASAPGTVTIDNSLGAVRASGLQFASGGYIIQGGPLTLVGPQSTVWVGDGTALGAGYVATINAAITGATQLVKTDIGTLVLSGANTYTGGTAINGGVLRVSADGNLGAAAGALSFNGGTLHTTANMTSARAVTLTGSGAFLTSAATTLTLSGAIAGPGALSKEGAGVLVLTGTGAFTGGTTISGGTLQLGAGGTSGSITGDVLNNGVLAFNRSDSMTFSGAISGAGQVRQVGTGTTTLTADSSSFAGTSLVEAGVLSVNGQLGGVMNVLGGRLQGTGTVGSTANFAGGTVAPGNGIGTLTINGNYAGNGGLLEIEAELAGDDSPADRLVVIGATSGTTNVRVINLGGAGAPTVEGVKIVDVGGASDGAFILQGDYVFEGEQAVVAGAFGYRLYKNGVSTPADGDWYLRSALINSGAGPDPAPLYQPGVPVYEAYGQALQGFNGLATMQQRVGSRIWGDGAVGGQGAWVRFEAASGAFDQETSTTGAEYDVKTAKLQLGVDRILGQTSGGQLVGGVAIHYGAISADIDSIYGHGGLDGEGYGLAATLTWQGEGGAYLDSQVQATVYDSDLSSSTAGRMLAEGVEGLGYGLSFETGRSIPLDPNWSLTPQVQLAYSVVDVEAFVDTFGALIVSDDNESLKTRLGLSADYRQDGSDRNGRASQTHAYGIANVFYEFDGETRVNVAGTSVTAEQDPLWGGVGVGAAYSWADNRQSLFGEVSANTSLENFGDSRTFAVTAGWRARW